MAAAVGWCHDHFRQERRQCDRVAHWSSTDHCGTYALGGVGGRGRSRGASEIMEQPVMAAILLPMVGQMGLTTALMVLTMAGAM